MSENILTDADIVITSYLPPDPDKRRIRLGYHLRQREELKELFPQLVIFSICSGYKQEDIKQLRSRRHHAVFYPKRLHKFQKHNKVLQDLYQIQDNGRAILLLDDDVVPADIPTPTSTVDFILDAIKSPKTVMPCPCLFFCCKGLLRDSFWKSNMNRENPYSPRSSVTGWAILVRSDFKVMLRHDEMVHEEFMPNDDTMFRFKGASLGKEVLTDMQIYFKSYQSMSNDKKSVWFDTREQRHDVIAGTADLIQQLWPWLLIDAKAEKIQPIWNAKGKLKRTLLNIGALKQTPRSLVPVPKLLKAYYEGKQEKRPSLADLL